MNTNVSRCTRKGCGQEYDPTNNVSDGCTFHSGGPVFHEGLKSWSCCSEVNKPVLTFDEFLQIPGCTRGSHTDEPPPVVTPKSSPNVNLKMTESTDGKEVYASKDNKSSAVESSAVESIAGSEPTPAVQEEEDLDTPVKPGTLCKHNGCGTAFVSDEANRKGDGEGTVCTYHPAPPIFREGSKGYLCCKRRVLEFEEFLKIEGCTKGRHIFVLKVKIPTSEEMVDCRIDHYQTLTEVHVSIFAKQVDKERSTITFEESQICIRLYLPGSKQFSRTLNLFGPINAAASSFAIFGTKVELHLKKQDNRSWIVLEKTNQNLGNMSLTFGVGGRTGTIGGKELVLDETNAATRA